MRFKFDFTKTAPAGAIAPYFPKGFHIGYVIKCEDAKPKQGEDQIKGFWLTIRRHPQYNAPGVDDSQEARVYGAYDDSNGFTKKMFMDILNKTEEQVNHLDFDPTHPTEGLTNHPVYFEARPESRVDKLDPNKKHNDTIILSQKEWAAGREEAARRSQPVGASIQAASSAQAVASSQAQVQTQQVQQAAPAQVVAPANGIGAVGGVGAVGGIGGIGALPGLPS